MTATVTHGRWQVAVLQHLVSHMVLHGPAVPFGIVTMPSTPCMLSTWMGIGPAVGPAIQHPGVIKAALGCGCGESKQHRKQGDYADPRDINAI